MLLSLVCPKFGRQHRPSFKEVQKSWHLWSLRDTLNSARSGRKDIKTPCKKCCKAPWHHDGPQSTISHIKSSNITYTYKDYTYVICFIILQIHLLSKGHLRRWNFRSSSMATGIQLSCCYPGPVWQLRRPCEPALFLKCEKTDIQIVYFCIAMRDWLKIKDYFCGHWTYIKFTWWCTYYVL